MPKPAHFNNNKSTITHSDFVSEAIQDLLKTNRIIEVNELPHVVNPLSVTVQNFILGRLIVIKKRKKKNFKETSWIHCMSSKCKIRIRARSKKLLTYRSMSGE